MTRKPIKVSYSRVSKYLNCPYSHYLYYVKKIRPKAKSKSLYFGSDFHRLLEHRGAPKEEIKTVLNELKIVYENQSDEFKEELGSDYIKNLKTIFLDYQKVWKNKPIPDKIEFEFNIDLGQSLDGEDIVLNGFIDSIYFDETGAANENTIIEDHKTFSVAPDTTIANMSMQKHLYAKAFEELTGYMPKEFMWDYIKNKPASEPKLLKNGKLSEAQSRSVTPYSWKRACKKLGIDDKDYIKKGKELYDLNTSLFFFQVVQPISSKFANETYENFKSAVADIVNKGHTNRIKNCGNHCAYCDMKPICMAEATGISLEPILEENFIQKS